MSDPLTRVVAGPNDGVSRPARPPAPAAPGMPRPAPPTPAPAVPPRLPPAPAALSRPLEEEVARPDSVRLQGVTKTSTNGNSALIDVELAIPSGYFVFLVGPSGAGKSTLIKLLVRDEKATKGRVEVAGHDLGRMRRREVPRLRRKIGIVFQDFRLLPRK